MFYFRPETDITKVDTVYHWKNNYKWANKGKDFTIEPDPTWHHFGVYEGGEQGIYEGGEFHGYITLKWLGENNFEIHIGLLPSIYGKSLTMGHYFLEFLSNLIPDSLLLAPVREDNKLAQRFVRKLGFIPIGYNIYSRSI
jgi:hypothetical protein